MSTQQQISHQIKRKKLERIILISRRAARVTDYSGCNQSNNGWYGVWSKQQQLEVGDGQKSHIHTDQMRFSRPPSNGARELRCAWKRDFLLLHAVPEVIGRLKRLHIIHEGEKSKTSVRFSRAVLAALQALLTATRLIRCSICCPPC